MDARKQFTFYESFASAIKRIKKKADRADLYDAIINYALYGQEPETENLPDAAAIAFDLIRPTLDASKRKSENGKRRSKRYQEEKKEANCEQIESKTEANDKQNDIKQKSNRKQTSNENKKEVEKEVEIEKEVEVEREEENECSISISNNPPIVPPFGTDEVKEAFLEFEKMRKRIKKPMTDRARMLLIGKLRKMAEDPHEQAEILNQSIVNCWAGIYPLKQDGKAIQHVQRHDDDLTDFEKAAVQRILNRNREGI